MSGRQYCPIFAGMALGRADVPNATVPMLNVVPLHEAGRPGTSIVEFGKAFGRKPPCVRIVVASLESQQWAAIKDGNGKVLR